ncbi:MAG: phospholipase [Bacteroidetes bacterium HGW-Bacteroidetes-6]|jgi:predicted peptidase|nr:MAG: phospholipase [Bacteroidetes bacterium HGW-Bacteroidetes-6]
MKREFFLLGLFLLALLPVSGLNAQNNWQSFLSKEKFVYKGNIQPYRLYLPDSIQPDEKLPLILFLHGAGERGNDNQTQLLHGVSHFMDVQIRNEYRFILIAPQCPEDARWVEVDWTLASHKMPARISVPLELSFALIDSLMSVYPVDSNRVYVTGLSMGGFGTWDAMQRRPGFFAASMPVCGGGDETQACAIIATPIKAFHGKLDHLVMPARTINMVNAVNQCGGGAECVLFPNLGHLCWEQVYSNVENLRWMFAQKRQN